MKHFLPILFACALLASCSDRNAPSYSSGKDLSVDGHTYFMVMKIADNPDTTFVSFNNHKFYLNDLYDGTFTQENEVVKVEQNSGMFPNRIFISYGDFLLSQGVQYTKLK